MRSQDVDNKIQSVWHMWSVMGVNVVACVHNQVPLYPLCWWWGPWNIIVGWGILGGGGVMGFKIEIVWLELEPFDLCDSWMNEGWICVSYDLINCPAKFPSNHINTVDLTVHTPTFGFCSANSETLFYDFTRWTLLLQCHIQEFFSLNIENTCNWKLVSLTIYGDNWTVTEA